MNGPKEMREGFQLVAYRGVGFSTVQAFAEDALLNAEAFIKV